MAVDFSQIRDQLMADKKQLGILLTLAVVGLLLWGRMALQSVPKTAMADDPAKSGKAKASSVVKPDDTRREVVKLALYDVMDRNVFWVNPAFYPKIEKPDKGKGDPAVAKPPVNPDRPPSDEELARARRLAIQEEAESLVLQSTILGSRPRAFINNTLLGAGETIEGFRVVKIDLRKVSLQKGDVIIVLEM